MKTLNQFAVFLEERSSHALAETACRITREQDIPIMRFFIPLTEKQLAEKIRSFLSTELLGPMKEGVIPVFTREKVKQWKWNAEALGFSGLAVREGDLVPVFCLLEQVFLLQVPAFTSDLHEAMAITMELKRYLQAVHAGAGKLIRELEKDTSAAAEQQDHEKLKFLANMSHEIRTPMNSIIGFANVVLGSELTPRQRDYLTAIKRSGENLLLLLSDIFDLAGNMGNTVSFEQTRLKEPPRVTRSEENKQRNGNGIATIKGIKILVAEDVALNQFLIKTLLEGFGFEHAIVSNGKEAIEKLKEERFDVILMDLQMPVLNGFEATRIIRSFMGSVIPIIALSADVTPADMKRCRDLGMNDHIPKPVDDKLLYRKIVELVTRSRKSSPQKEWRGAGHSDLPLRDIKR